MRYEFHLFQKAASILMVGTAFFFFACQPRMVVERAPIEAPMRPVVEEKFSDLYAVAEAYLQAGRYKDALEAFTKIITEYPDHPETPVAKYNIARIHYQMGDFQNSLADSQEWLKVYPESQLKGEVLYLLGNSFNALGDKPKAFLWLLKAKGTPSDKYISQDRQDNLDALIVDLIRRSQFYELKEMAEYGADSIYAPHIYQRMANISLDENRLEEAKSFAMQLVRSTQEQSWVSIGQELLEKILREIEVGDELRRVAIGCLLPLNGPFALYGQELLNGIMLGMDIFNQSNIDQPIELIIRDTGGREEETLAAIEELVHEEKVMTIIGPLASGPATAAVEKAQELGISIITFTQKDGITRVGDMVFRNFLTPLKEVEAILNRSFNELGMRRFAILYPDNQYGHFFMNLFWDKVEEIGGTITAVESYKPDDTDFAVGIKKMVGLYYPRPESVVQMLKDKEKMELIENKEEMGDNSDLEEGNEYGVVNEEEEEPEPIVDFDAVFIPDNHQQIALIAPQFPFYNVFNVPFLGTSLWLSDELIETAGDYVQGAIFPAGFFIDNDLEGVKDFVEDYKENFESNPGVLAANGYDTIRLIRELMNNSIIKTRRDFQQGLSEVDNFFGVTGRISFDHDGEVEKDPVLLVVYGKSLHLLH